MSYLPPSCCLALLPLQRLTICVSPSGKDVTKDTVEDRNAATPHPSAEQDMKKMAEEKKKMGTDHETEKGGNKGDAQAFDQ